MFSILIDKISNSVTRIANDFFNSINNFVSGVFYIRIEYDTGCGNTKKNRHSDCGSKEKPFRIPVVHRIVPAERVQVQAAADAYRVVREPAAEARFIPAGAEAVEAGGVTVLAALEEIAEREG